MAATSGHGAAQSGPVHTPADWAAQAPGHAAAANATTTNVRRAVSRLADMALNTNGAQPPNEPRQMMP